MLSLKMASYRHRVMKSKNELLHQKCDTLKFVTLRFNCAYKATNTALDHILYYH